MRPSRTPTDGFRHAAATKPDRGPLRPPRIDPACSGGALRHAWRKGILGRRTEHRGPCPPLAVSHADGNRESRIHPPALLPGLVALGEGVPQHRGGNPRGSSDLRCRPRACRLLDRARARERACRHDHCRAGRGQPIPRLVLAGGSLVFATDTAQRDRAAAHTTSGAPAERTPICRLGGGLRPGARDALFRRVSGAARGRDPGPLGNQPPGPGAGGRLRGARRCVAAAPGAPATSARSCRLDQQGADPRATRSHAPRLPRRLRSHRRRRPGRRSGDRDCAGRPDRPCLAETFG